MRLVYLVWWECRYVYTEIEVQSPSQGGKTVEGGIATLQYVVRCRVEW
jgi:hypothetical protein